ncbi:unnamed protein product, partial [marine sediment metagenome]
MVYADGLEHIKRKPTENKIPIFIPLREAVEKEFSLEEYTVDTFASFGFPNAQLFIQRILNRGDALVLLDGLDEVGASRIGQVNRSIDGFTVQYPKNTIVVTCRTAAYTASLRRFVEVEVVEFSDSDIKKFVGQWFKGDKTNKGPRLLRELSLNLDIKDLTSTPLLLSLICILYYYDLRLPRNKVEVYERCVDTLLREWDASRDFIRETKYDSLSHERKKNLLAGIAAHFTNSKRFSFTQSQLVSAVGHQIERFGIEAEEAEGVLKEIESHHGILIKRTENVFAFSHLT